MKLVTLEDNLSSCNKCRKKSDGNGNSNNNINIVIDNAGGNASQSPASQKLPSRLHEPKQPTENSKKTDEKIDALLREIQEMKNNPQKVEKQTILRYIPHFIDRIKKVFVQTPYNRTVERVRDRVEQVPYNQTVERVRDKVEQVPYNQTIERVRDRVEQVPHNNVVERIKKRYIIMREYQPTPPRGL